MRIALCRLRACVSQQFAYLMQCHASGHANRREAVPQVMHAEVFDAGVLAAARKKSARRLDANNGRVQVIARQFADNL
jgi:hypothetical protein